MPEFMNKPVVIEAWQFTKENFKNGVPEEFKDESVRLWSQYGGKVIEGEIKTLEGNIKVSENDWIIKGVNNEFFTCNNNIFGKIL